MSSAKEWQPPDIGAFEKAVPAHLRAGLLRYIRMGGKPGKFLRAVLDNDLGEAIGRGDRVSLRHLPTLVLWIRNSTPRLCWGLDGPRMREEWTSLGGMMGGADGPCF